MVLAELVDRWLEKEKEKEAEYQERLREPANIWLSSLGLPSLRTLMEHGTAGFTREQHRAAAHVVDVVKNAQCTDPTCPYRSWPIPEFLKG